jgi:hypothetical protein
MFDEFGERMGKLLLHQTMGNGAGRSNNEEIQITCSWSQSLFVFLFSETCDKDIHPGTRFISERPFLAAVSEDGDKK